MLKHGIGGKQSLSDLGYDQAKWLQNKCLIPFVMRGVVCVYVCVRVCLKRPEEGIRFPGAGCKPLNMDTRN